NLVGAINAHCGRVLPRPKTSSVAAEVFIFGGNACRLVLFFSSSLSFCWSARFPRGRIARAGVITPRAVWDSCWLSSSSSFCLDGYSNLRSGTRRDPNDPDQRYGIAQKERWISLRFNRGRTARWWNPLRENALAPCEGLVN